jgi:ribonuclease P protein component
VVPRALQGQQFPSCLRLRQAQDFRNALRSRRRWKGEWFNLSVSPNALGKSRLGIIVARKVVPHAVKRNWLKRTVREGFRRVARQLPPVDLVVQVTRLPADRAAHQLARAELQRLLATIHP